MKQRRSHAKKKPRKRTTVQGSTWRETAQPTPLEQLQPTERERQETYDVERNGVPKEVGPDEAEVDPRLEH